MKAILKVLIVWITLLAVPLQGFASATMFVCVPPTAAQHDDDHKSMADDTGMSNAHSDDEHAGPDMKTDHHAGKCATCATCGSCVSMAPSFLAVLPATASSSITIPFERQLLPSVHLALPERPPRA